MSLVEQKRFGDLCKFIRGPFGGSLKKNCFKPHGIAVYEQQHAIYDQFESIRYFIDEEKFQEMKRFELFPGDLIMSCSGTMGKVAIVPNHIKKGIINQALLKLTPSDKLDVKYLRYWMESENFQYSINKKAVGAAIKNVASVKILKEIDLPYFEIKQQQQIVQILDKAFAKIDQAIANIEQNIQNAEDLFQSKLNQIFSQQGEGWEEKKLGEVGKIQTGTTPPTKDKSNYGNYISFIKPAHFNNDGSIDSGESQLSVKGLSKGRIIDSNSVLMVCIGATIGKTGFVTKPVSCNQQINSLTPENGVTGKLFYYALISPFVQKQVMSIGKGSQATLPIINKTKWSNLKVRYPLNIVKQEDIVANLDLIRYKTNQSISNYQNKLRNLKELKKSLLEKAFSGELTKNTLK